MTESQSSYPSTNLILIDSVGAWPESTLDDINTARIKLMELGRFAVSTTYGSEITVKSLDYMFFKTDITYRMFFKNNNLTEFIIDKTLENDVVLVVSEDCCVQINGVVFSWVNDCAFCSNEIRLHKEAVKLKDERLVCHVCYAKVFDSILQSSPTITRNEK